MRVRLFCAAVLLAFVPGLAYGQAGSAFTPVPCPEQAWEYTDPTFQPLTGAKAFSGRYDGGLYQIEIPDNWNGELVLYAHGAVRNNTLRVQTPLIRAHLIGNGFAWGASSYRCNGSVYGIGLVDTMALSDVFQKVNQGRAAKRTYLTGQSLGGRITILGVREFPARFDGGLAMCPAGQEGNDIRAGIAAAAELITGIRPQPETLDADVKRMAGILGPPAMLTDKGKQLASIQIQLSGGPRPFAVEGLQGRLMANISDGVRMEPSWINRASTNVGLRYAIDEGLGITSAELNTRMPRKQPEGNLRTRSGPYRELVPFDGNIQRPLLSIHGTGDLQTPVAQQQALRRAVVAAGTADRLVQRLMRIPGHCQFSEQEQVAAFDDLVKWVRQGVKPEGDDVMGDLSDAGKKFTNPLRPGDPGTLNVVPRRAGTR
jgi:hypothetical protein